MSQNSGRTRPANKGKRIGAALLAALFLLIAINGIAFAQDDPEPVQVFYIPIEEHHALASMDEINSNARAPIYGYTSIAIGTDETYIYYDHWEDDFEPNFWQNAIKGPSNSFTTEIWGNGECDDGFPPNRDGTTALTCTEENEDTVDRLMAGNVVVLRATISQAQMDAGRPAIDFDAGDKIGASDQIAVARVYWGEGQCTDSTGAGTCLAGASEVYPTTEWRNQYVVPVGEAITYVSNTAPTAVGTPTIGSSTTNNGSLAISTPTGLLEGDLLVAIVVYGHENNITSSGWTQVATGSVAGSGDDIRVTVLYKFVGASEPASHTFSGSSNDRKIGTISAYRNAGVPTGGTTSSGTGGSNTNSAPNLSYVANSIILHAGGILTNATRGLPTGFTVEPIDNGITGNGGISVAYARRSVVAAGSTGSVSTTYDASASAKNVGAHIAIPPRTVTLSNLSEMFEINQLSIQVLADGTTVTVDRDGPDGPLAPQNFGPLAEGRSVHVEHVYQGATVSATTPVQVHMLSGDDGSDYEYSVYTLVPQADWDKEYYSPVSGQLPSGSSTYQTQILVFNGNNVTINVRCDFMGTSNDSTQTVGPGGVAVWGVPANSGARCYTPDSANQNNVDANGLPFFAISTVDAENIPGNSDSGRIYDWGLTMMPRKLLDAQVLIGLGIGRDPNAPLEDPISNTENGSPVWVTPVATTFFFVDANGDGCMDTLTADGSNSNIRYINNYMPTSGTCNPNNPAHHAAGLSRTALSSMRIFDQVDRDQTGMQIYSGSTATWNGAGFGQGADFIAAWGEDPGPASDAYPGFDVGVTNPSLKSMRASKGLDAGPDGFVTPGEIITYTITIKNSSKFGTLTNIKVFDEIPLNTTYQAGSTSYKLGTNAPVAIPDTGDNLFPLDDSPPNGPIILSSLAPGAEVVVRFRVKVADFQAPLCNVNLVNIAKVSSERLGITTTREVNVQTPISCLPKLIVEKKIVGGDGTTPFNFSGFFIYPNFTLTPPAGGSISNEYTVSPASHTVSELNPLPAGWTFQDVVCINVTGDAPPAIITGQTATVNMTGQDYNDIVKCTFTNKINPGVLTIDKTASATVTREYGWDVIKRAPEDQHVFDGEIFSLTYDVTATRKITNTSSQVTGLITVTNSGPGAASITGVTDTLAGGGGGSVTPQCTLNGNPVTPSVGTPVVLPASQQLKCSYTSTGFNGNVDGSYTNTANITRNDGGNTPSKVVDVVLTKNYIGDEQLEVDDTDYIGVNPVTATTPNPQQFTYTGTPATFKWTYATNNITCEQLGVVTANYSGGKASVTIDNKVTKKGTTNPVLAQDSVVINCYRLLIDKTVQPTHQISYTWKIEKSVDQELFTLNYGESDTANYTVEVSRTSKTLNHNVAGTITITNPNPKTDAVPALTDTLNETPITVQCPADGDDVEAGETVTVLKSNKLVCSYSQAGSAGVTPSNVAKVSLFSVESSTGIRTQPYGAPTGLADDSEPATITVSDTTHWDGVTVNPLNMGPDNDTSDGTGKWVYSHPVSCGVEGTATGTEHQYEFKNTAKIVELPKSGNATVKVNCTPVQIQIRLDNDDDNAVTYSHTHTATVNVSYDGGLNWSPLLGADVEFDVTNAVFEPVGVDSCVTNNAGKCAVTFVRDSVGTSVINATAEASISGFDLSATTVGVSDSVPPANGGPANKVWHDLRIRITPDLKTNPLDQDHVFTIWVERSSNGSTWTGVDGVSVDWTLDWLVTPDPAQPASGNGDTSDGGKLLVTIDSLIANQFTLNASINHALYPGQPLVRSTSSGTPGPGGSGPAIKNYADAKILIEKNAVNAVGTTHTFTVTVLKNPGTGWIAAADQEIVPTITGVGSQVAAPNGGTCQLPGGKTDVNGKCTIIITSSTAGETNVSVKTTVDFPDGAGKTVETNGTGGSSTPGVKTWVDLSILIDPETDTNPLNQSHTFTVTVLQNLGGATPAWSALQGAFPEVTVDKPSDWTLDSENCSTTGTNGDGKCWYTIKSAVPNVYTAHAKVTASVLGQSMTRDTDPATADGAGPVGTNRSAVKKYVTAKITILADDTNAVDDPHTFTVKVEKHDGTSWSAASGVDVTPSLVVGSVGSITGGTCLSENTNGSGQCTIIVNSLIPGLSTVSASATVPVGTNPVVQVPVSTDGTGGNSAPGKKTWVDLSIRIDPLLAYNPLNQSHTFTVTVLQNLGGATPEWIPLEGAFPTVSIAETGWTPGDNTCDAPDGTNEDGECYFTIDSAVVGTYTANATVTASVLGQEMTRDTDPTNGDNAGPEGTNRPAVKHYVDIQIEKTFAGVYKETYTWEITKTVEPTETNLFLGDEAEIDWTIEVVKSGPTYSGTFGWKVVVTNTSEIAVEIEELTDGMDGVVLNCPDADPTTGIGHVLDPQESLTCTATGQAFGPVQSLPTIPPNTATVKTTGGATDSDEPDNVQWTLLDTINESVNVQDDNIGFNNDLWKNVQGSFEFSYPETVSCTSQDIPWIEYDQDTGTGYYELYNNAVVNTNEDVQDTFLDDDDATAVVNCYELAVVPQCVADAPVLTWELFGPDADQKSLTIEYLNATTEAVLYTFTGQSHNSQMLWPESNTDTGLIGGNGIQWPGWTQNPNGTWTDNGSQLRPQVKVRFSFNPSETHLVTYPPSEPTCATAPRAVIGDRVWYDSDGDGIQDDLETGAPDVTVQIFQVGGSTTVPYKTTTTDANGIYTFTVVGGYEYYIVFSKPNGYVYSPANAVGANDATDSDGDATGKTANFLAPAGSVDKTWDEGLVGPTITVNKVTTGVDSSGVSHTGDGITIEYLKPVTWTYTITNSSQVPLLVIDYIDSKGVDIECPVAEPLLAPGQSVVCIGKGTANTINYSNVVTVTGRVPESEVVVKATDPSSYVCKGNELYGVWYYEVNDVAGFQPEGGDFLFKDATNTALVPNDLKNLTLPIYLSQVGVPEVTGTKIVLSKDGRFQFSDLVVGAPTYTLRVGDDALTPFGYSVVGSSLRFNIKGEDCTSKVYEFGYKRDSRPVVGDLVWYDVNRNGIQDEWYDANNDGKVTTNNVPAVLDENGYVSIPFGQYEFLDLNGNGKADLEGELNRCGIRSVGPTVELLDQNGVKLDDALVGNTGYYRFRSYGDDDTPLASDGTYGVQLVTTGDLAEKLTEGALEIALTGLCKPLSIDPNAPDLEIINYNATVGAADVAVPAGAPEEDLVCSTTSDTVLQRNLSTYENGIALDYDYGIQCQPPIRQVDASSLGDFVWHDLNKDGIQDAGEPGMSNITVQLYRVDTPSGSGTTPLATTTTNANGRYAFTGLDAGTYYVQVIVPNGVLISPQNAGASDLVDSDIDSTGRTVNITLPVNVDDPTWDAGLYFAPTADPDDPNGEPGGSLRFWLPIIGAGQ